MNQEQKKASGLGKRKTSIAKALIQPGRGLLTINQLPFDQAFLGSLEKKESIKKQFDLFNWQTDYEIKIQVKGGGIESQLEAIQLALAKAFCQLNPSFRPFLKKQSLLTRDARIKETRKYGLKKARKASQYSKR